MRFFRNRQKKHFPVLRNKSTLSDNTEETADTPLVESLDSRAGTTSNSERKAAWVSSIAIDEVGLYLVN